MKDTPSVAGHSKFKFIAGINPLSFHVVREMF